MVRQSVTAAACLSAVLGLAVPCGAADIEAGAKQGADGARRQVTALQRLTDLRPQRLAAFRQTLADFGGLEPGAPMLHFQAEYASPAPSVKEKRQAWLDQDDTLRVPLSGGYDWESEAFLIADREDDFVDASGDWVERRVKGSDAMARTRSNREIKPKFGWDGGPLAGFGKGPVSMIGGEDQVFVRYTRHMKRPGWLTRVSCGVEDGEQIVAFSIGRSLYRGVMARR